MWPDDVVAYGQTGLHSTNNLCATTLSASISNSATTISIASATTKTTWPTSNFIVHIYHLETDGSKTGDELVFVTSRSGTTLSTCVRGFGGTAGVSHASADKIEVVEASELIQILATRHQAVEQWAGLGFGATTNTKNYNLHTTTTNATQTEATLDGAAGSSSNRIPTTSNASYTMKALVTACTNDASPANGAWIVTGSAVNNGGTLTVTDYSVDTIFRSVESWDIDYSSSTSYLEVLVKGSASTTIKWSTYVTVARIDK